ncbi:MAG: hypothetical protein LBP76_07250 [Treponema sp.]|jgi:uncharacterized protein YfaS (alpha-2-macroglobulin family)|nr:hypothetical protein [Treponema sp.]
MNKVFFRRCIIGRGLYAALFLMFLLPRALWAQNEPSGGDAPIKAGEAVILYQEAPKNPEWRTTERYLRTAIIPMSRPEGPIRIRFEKTVDASLLNQRTTEQRFFSSVKDSSDRTVRGVWTWAGGKELQFKPAEKPRTGAWLYVEISGSLPLAGESGSRKWASVSARLYFEVEYFQMGGKTGSRPVTSGQPRFVAFLNSGTGQIGEGPLCLLYDQPLESWAFPLVSVSAGGKQVPVRSYHPESLFFDNDGRYETSHILALSFPEMPADGTRVVVRYPLMMTAGAQSYAEQTFSVFTNFYYASDDLDRIRRGRAARLESRWEVEFNSPIDPVSFEDKFSITPQPPSLRFSYYGSSVVIRAAFETGKPYYLQLAPEFTDLLGNRLRTPLAFDFRSQDLPPVFELPKENLVVEADTNRIPVKYRNVRDITAAVYRYDDVSAYIQSLAAGSPGLGKRSLQGVPLTIRPFPNTLNNLYQADFGIESGAGLKLVEISAGGRGSEAGSIPVRRIMVQSTNLGVSAKVSGGTVLGWVTWLYNAVPVQGAKLSLYSASGLLLAETTATGKDGIGLIKTDKAFEWGVEEPLYLAAEMGKDTAVCRIVNNELSSAWQFNLAGAVRGVNSLAASFFTERGVYRPGESVYFKTFLRNLDEYNGLSPIVLSIRDSRGKEVYNLGKNLDSYRGAAWEFRLPQDAGVGEYTAALRLGIYTANTSFRVEEYRVPTFQVSVSSPDSEWKIDTPVTVEASAEYLRGGVMAGKPFSWRVYRQSEIFAPPAFPGYTFGPEPDPLDTGTVHDEQGVLDNAGKARLVFRPSFSDIQGPMRYIVQSSVTDDDRQNYAGRMSRLIHRTELYAGIRPPAKTIYRGGETVKFPYIVTDTQGRLAAGSTVAVYLETLRYNQNTMLDDEGRTSTYNREIISSSLLGNIVSGAAPRDYSYRAGKAGMYRLRFEVRDAGGRSASSSFTFTVSGDETSAWPRFDRERIDLILSKQNYRIGEEAAVVVQTPFETARGLLTIEANGVLDAYPFVINRDTPQLTFPVKAEYAPNAFVSVILLRGRVHYAKDATGFETGAPAYRIGYARFEADPDAQRLTITVNAPKTASPGQTFQAAFTVKNPAGLPTDASAAVMVVDEAVLGMTGYATPDPVKAAYSLRVLSVRNASNVLDLPHSRRARYEALFPAGDSDDPAMLPWSDDMLRRLFRSTAFFAPAVPVDGKGQGSFTFTLPDNLTTYRIMIVAVNRQGQMGSVQSSLQSRRDLMIEPALPRFVYEDDVLTVQARVFNGTETASSVSVNAQFTGFQSPGRPLATVTVGGGSSAMVSWQGRIQAGFPQVKFRFSAVMGNVRDDAEYSIPVRVRGNRQRSTANVIVNGKGDLVLPLPAARTGGSVELTVSETPLSELKDSVEFLMRYPHGCIEQTTSETYPLIVLADILPAIGVKEDPAAVKKFADAGVARLMTFRTPSGGLSFWPGESSPHAFGTAFGLSALIEARKRGWNIPQDFMDGMVKYLESIIAKGNYSREMYSPDGADADTLAFFAMTLGRMNRPQLSLIQDLWRSKDRLTPFGLSFLAVAVKESGDRTAPLSDVLAEIRKAAVETADSATFPGSPRGNWSFDTPTRANAAALMAYAIGDPQNLLTAKFLRGLMDKRRDGLWGTTQGNVFGIMAIYHLASGSALTGQRAPLFTVSIDGKTYAASAFSSLPSGKTWVLTVNEAELPAARQDPRTQGIQNRSISFQGKGTVYLTAKASYDMPIDSRFLAPQDKGIRFTRSFETLDGRALGSVIPLGSIVRVRLGVQTRRKLNYAAFDDLLPAGFEILNTNLLTTENVGGGGESAEAVRTGPLTNFRDFRDYRAAFYTDELPAGSYEFVYYVRATTPGTFFLPISLAETMYDPDTLGTTGGGSMTIR